MSDLPRPLCPWPNRRCAPPRSLARWRWPALSLFFALGLSACASDGPAASPDSSVPDFATDTPAADLTPLADQLPWPDLKPADGPAIDPGIDLGNGVTVWPSHLSGAQEILIRYQGTLSSNDNVSLHLGFNGWNQLAGVDLTPEDDGTGNTDYFMDLPMTPRSDGPGYEATLSLPTDARGLHFVFFSTVNQERSWDNNGTEDYNLGLRFPLIGPYLTLQNGSSATPERVVNFVTGHSCRGRVDFGPSQPFGQSQEETSAGRHHRVPLGPLAANTTYSYQVSCGGREPSQLFSFTTPPANSDALTFLALADGQEGGEGGRWPLISQEIVAHHPDAAFLIFAGDMSWNNRPGLWWTFFDSGHELFARLPLLPAVGNHDTPTVNSNTDTSSYQLFFPQSGDPLDQGTYYALRHGSAAFIALNSEWAADFSLQTGAQFVWTQQTLDALEAASEPPSWVFAFWHIPPYNTGARHLEQQGTFRDMTSLFDGRVDWVFGGHEHLYQRMKPLRYNAQLASSGNYGRSSSDGVGYLVLPPAGAWPESAIVAASAEKGYYRDRLAFPQPSPEQTTVPSEIGFVRVELMGQTITIKTYGLGVPEALVPAHLVDSLSYTR